METSPLATKFDFKIDGYDLINLTYRSLWTKYNYHILQVKRYSFEKKAFGYDIL